MKTVLTKSILLVALSILTYNAFTQNTIQQWNVAIYNNNFMPPETTQPYWSTYFYKTAGDTLINTENCTKLIHSNDSLFTNFTYCGALKNKAGKLSLLKNNKDYLLYDFSLNINDTTFVYRYFNEEPFLWKVQINSITDTLINDRTLKKFEVSYSDSSGSFNAIDTICGLKT